MSAIVQTSWGLLMPFIGFGDEILSLWFLIESWSYYTTIWVWLRWIYLFHFIIMLFVYFIFAFNWMENTSLGKKSFAFKVFWGVLACFNLNEFYIYWTKKRCCSSIFCFGIYQNKQFTEAAELMFDKQFAIRAFAKDLIQIICQITYIISKYYGQTSVQQGDFLTIISLIFAIIFLAIAILYFIIFRLICRYCLGVRCCQLNLCDCVCLFGENKMVKQSKFDETMIEIITQ